VLRGLEKDLHAPAGFLTDLFVVDDWSVIIKSHALIEGAVTFLLSSVLDPRLRPVFADMPLGRVKSEKLEFTKALDLLTQEERGFIRVLSALRNALAHDVTHLGFKLQDHLNSLDEKQRAAFLISLAFDLPADEKTNWVAFIRERPKEGIIAAATRLVLKCVTMAARVAPDNTDDGLVIDYARLLHGELDAPKPSS
jgi:hypothetical protein